MGGAGGGGLCSRPPTSRPLRLHRGRCNQHFYSLAIRQNRPHRSAPSATMPSGPVVALGRNGDQTCGCLLSWVERISISSVTNDLLRRVSPIASRLGEGRLTERTSAVRPSYRGLLFMARRVEDRTRRRGLVALLVIGDACLGCSTPQKMGIPFTPDRSFASNCRESGLVPRRKDDYRPPGAGRSGKLPATVVA
jgi:hypothetical protein